MTTENDAVRTVAGLMALAARTAPKACGLDSIKIEIVTGKEQKALGDKMIAAAKETGMDFLRINGEQVKASDATVLIGVEGTKTLGINCGGCGYPGCAEMVKAQKGKKNKDSAYTGPNCVLKISDLGIAVGSAAKTAQIHNVDNRIMYTAGFVALKSGYLKGCSVAYGLPLRASGKSIYFDVQFGH
jgi:uncharacterized ferredoxin-like protein